MSTIFTLVGFDNGETRYLANLDCAEKRDEQVIPPETLALRDVMNLTLFTRSVQWCLKKDDEDSKIALESLCEQIVDCPNVLANVQYFLPLISEYLHDADRSSTARRELIQLTDRSLEVLTKLSH